MEVVNIMKLAQLSKKQNIALSRLSKARTWQSAFDLGVELNTLHSLVKKGFIVEKYVQAGSYQKTNFHFKIKD